MPLDFVSNTDEKVPIYVAPVTAGGRPAKVDGVPTFEVLEGGATFQAATDDERAANPTFLGHVVSEDSDGASVYVIKADADLGEGVTEITETGTYTYSAAPAISMGARAGTAVPK